MTALIGPDVIRLYPFQAEALDAIYADWDADVTPTAVVLPTGSGKTTIFTAVIKRWIRENRPGRALLLVDRDELVKQAAATIVAEIPGADVGVVKAARDETGHRIIIASVQTLRRPERMARLSGVGMIVIDECDLAMAPGYQDILSHYGALTGDIPCVGVTATLERTDGQGFGSLFRNVAYTRDIMWMIRHGYLSDVRGLTVAGAGIDLSAVRRSRIKKDYDDHELGEVMEQEKVTLAIADAYLEHAPGRRAVHFAPTVASAEAQAAAYNRAGVTAEVVTGETPLDDRGHIYRRFRTGETSILVNCMVLTRGWDAPWAEVAVMGRPTQSSSLYIQCVGRVLRKWPGKDKALVLDVVGAARQHKLITLIDMAPIPPKDGESLLEAEEREMSEQSSDEMIKTRRNRGPKWEKDGGLTEVNLFAQSSTAWLQTVKGIWFINTRATTWFLWEYPDDTYGVATYANADWRGRPVMHQTGLPMALAMGIAEQAATRADPSIASRASSWRKGNVEPTQAQRDTLERMGQPPREGMTKNEASDAISVAVASRRIDPYVT